ncbi:hypothetical protein ES703_42743 [subsurface metagenome]
MPNYLIDTSNATFDDNERKVARKSDGTLCCVYIYRTGGVNRIWLATSTDEGRTWSTEAITTILSDQAYPTIAIDSNDNIHVVWSGLGWGANPDCQNIQYRRKTAGGWQAQEAVTDTDAYQVFPVIAVDSQDNVHVAWAGKGWGANPGIWNEQYRQRTGAGWQAQEAITDINESQDVLTIAIDSSDVVHVVWSGNGWGANPGFKNLQYRQRTGAGWQAQVAITDDAINRYPYSLAIDSNDYLHLVLEGAGIEYSQRIAAWSALVTVATGSSPSISIDNEDVVQLTYDASTTRIGQKSKLPGGWTAERQFWYPNECPSHIRLLWAKFPAGQNVVDAGYCGVGYHTTPVDEVEFFRCMFSSGMGTSASPYVVMDVNQLQDMYSAWDLYFELGQDIDAIATSGWNAGAGFIPVCETGLHDYFTGSFDGKGYDIDSLFINRPGTNYMGLFGFVAGNAAIKNVGVTNCDITGDDGTGALIGYILGFGVVEVEACHSSGVVNASWGADGIGGLMGEVGSPANISQSYSQCQVNGAASGSNVGGLIGSVNHANVVLNQCYATGAVTTVAGGDWGSGGFAGYCNGQVSKCFATGDVSGEDGVGGFVGDTGGNSDISDCYARGDVTASYLPDPNMGGFTSSNSGTIDNSYSTGLLTGIGDGSLAGGFCGQNTGTITDCFWDTETSGMATSDGGTGKTTTEMKTQTTFTDAGWDFATIWGMFVHCEDGYACLQNVTPDCCSVVVIPTVTTNPATAIEPTSATLNGTLVDDGGEPCGCGFEWGETEEYGETTPPQSKTTGQDFSQAISGLSPGTTYHFRAFATNSAGTSYGDDRSFTTLVAIPTVTTEPATDVVQKLATLSGTLDSDGGEDCQVRFQYGLTDAYGTDTEWQPGKVTGDSPLMACEKSCPVVLLWGGVVAKR